MAKDKHNLSSVLLLMAKGMDKLERQVDRIDNRLKMVEDKLRKLNPDNVSTDLISADHYLEQKGFKVNLELRDSLAEAAKVYSVVNNRPYYEPPKGSDLGKYLFELRTLNSIYDHVIIDMLNG